MNFLSENNTFDNDIMMLYEHLNNFDEKHKDNEHMLLVLVKLIYKCQDDKECVFYVCWTLMMFHKEIINMLKGSKKISMEKFVKLIEGIVNESSCDGELKERIVNVYAKALNVVYSSQRCEVVNEINFGVNNIYEEDMNSDNSYNEEEEEDEDNVVVVGNNCFKGFNDESWGWNNSNNSNNKRMNDATMCCSNSNSNNNNKGIIHYNKNNNKVNYKNNIINSNNQCNSGHSSNSNCNSNNSSKSNNRSNSNSNIINISFHSSSTSNISGILKALDQADCDNVSPLDNNNNNNNIKHNDPLFQIYNAYDNILTYIYETISSSSSSLIPHKGLHDHFVSLPLKNQTETTELKLLTLLIYIFPFLTYNQKQSNINKLKSSFQHITNISLFTSNVLYINTTSHSDKNYFQEFLDKTIKTKHIDISFYDKLISKSTSLTSLRDMYIIFTLYIKFNLSQYNHSSSSSSTHSHMFFNIGYILIYTIEQMLIDKNTTHLSLCYDLYIIKTIYDAYSQFKPQSDHIHLKYNSHLNTFIFNNITFNNDVNDLITIDSLFDNDIIAHYHKVNKRCGFFYKTQYLPLYYNLRPNTLQFILRNSQLQYFIDNEFDVHRHKAILIQLEEEMFSYTKHSLHYVSNEIYEYHIPHHIQTLFNDLNNDLHSRFPEYDFTLFPFGSTTQFVNSKTSDLDIYLYIDNPLMKDEFIHKLVIVIRNYYDMNYVNTNSNRICLFSFTYKNSIKIDLACIGQCPYLHSNLLRRYSLIDARFVIIALNLKYFLKLISLENDNDNKIYLNSFSWMMLLITFLQDVIHPPVLPKLLMNANDKVEVKVEIGGAKKQMNSAITMNVNVVNKYKHKKSIRNALNGVDYVSMNVSKRNFKNYKQVYTDMIVNGKRNEMSCGEIFLKFLEFVVFYLKNDAVFVNCSYNYEGIMNFNDIKYQNKDEKMKEFYKKYIVKGKRMDALFFREPYDANYNPGHSLGNYNEFINKLKNAFFVLMRCGSFKKLENN